MHMPRRVCHAVLAAPRRCLYPERSALSLLVLLYSGGRGGCRPLANPQIAVDRVSPPKVLRHVPKKSEATRYTVVVLIPAALVCPSCEKF